MKRLYNIIVEVNHILKYVYLKKNELIFSRSFKEE